MRAAIFIITAVAALSGCEPGAAPSERSVSLTREGVRIQDAGAQPVTVALPGWVYAGEPYCPPAFAIGPKQEIVVTSNAISTLWRIDANLAVTVHPLALDVDTDKDVGFAAIMYSPEHAAFIAYSDVQRSVWKIDRGLNTGLKLIRTDFMGSRTCATH